MPLPKIIDNERKQLLETLLSVAGSHKTLSVATGYWDIEGMAVLLDAIKDYDQVRILIGREPLLKRDNTKEIEAPEPDYPDEDFYRDLQRIQPSAEHSEVVIKMKEMIDAGKLQVRVYRRSFLHAKCFIFGDYSSHEAVGVIGSSNFTRNGLTTNTELNALEEDHRLVVFQPQNEAQENSHLSWFDQKWNDEMTEEWTGEFMELVRTSKHGDLLFSPRELYLRTLMEVYKDKLSSEKEEIINPHSKTLFEFQQKNVQNLRRILKENGVAMLADSVGLGKTVSAIGVIKQYQNQRVVVIAPKTLTGQWELELVQEGLHNVRVVSLQNKEEINKQRELDKYAPVGLFVIDESHNLRSHNSVRYEMLADWIASSHNEAANVLLVTATPINNSLTDLTNQILLGARGDQDIFTIAFRTSEGVVVNRSFYEAIDNIRKQIQQNVTQGKEDLSDIYEQARYTIEPIIRNFVVRNTRQAIGSITNPDGSVSTFPKVLVKNIRYPQPKGIITVSEQLQKTLSVPVERLADTMDTLLHPLRQTERFDGIEASVPESPSSTYQLYQMILSLSFVPYRWRMYDFRYYGKSKDEIKKIRLTADEQRKLNMQLSLYGIMRTLFLKRLESSVKALEVSLQRYHDRLEIFEDILEKEGVIINLSDVDDILDEFDADDGEQRTYDKDTLVALAQKKAEDVDANFKRTELEDDIAKEKELVKEIITQLAKVREQDAKIAGLKDRLLEEHQANPDKKILVFSFFADTIDYISESIANDDRFSHVREKIDYVSGRDRKAAIHAAKRFAPVAQKATDVAERDGQLTYLFATDVLSEGQNLQDAGHLINYDLHWNPVRMVQRNGRINRLGSTFDEVYVENFIPGDDLEAFLGLMQKINQKIELIKHAIGNDSSIFGEEIDPRSYTGLYAEDVDTATKQYEALENKLETFSDDVFYADLMRFYAEADEAKIRQIERITHGTWTISGENFEDPNEVIVMSEFTLDAGKKKQVFFGNTVTASSLDVIPPVLALKQIRSADDERKVNHFEVDKDQQAKVVTDYGAQIAGDQSHEENLTPTKEKVLSASTEYGWTAEEKDKLRATLMTRNVILGRKVTRLVRTINAALNANEPAEKEYKRLKELLVEPPEPPAVNQIDVLFGFSSK